MQDLQYRTTEQEDPDIYSIIKFGLESANMEAVGTTRQPINVYAYERQTVVAGVVGYVTGAALIIKYLWVDRAFRSNGVARYLMRAIENEAQGRGCKHCFIDTMSYQAPDFYHKVGFEEVARIEGFHDEHDRIFLKKTLG